MSKLPVTLEDVQYAAARIGDAVVHTPCLRSETLSRIAKADVWVKFENLQFTASFKERGALNTLLQLTDAEKKRGVIAMSAGNQAQGVAYHAGRLGTPTTIRASSPARARSRWRCCRTRRRSTPSWRLWAAAA
jgi:threonine dehydratase